MTESEHRNRMRGATERLPLSSAGSVIGGWVLCLTLVLGFNLVAGQMLEGSTPNRGYWLIQKKWEILRDLEESVDVLVVGDSSCNQGLNNRVLDQQTRLRSMNLCTIGDALLLDDLWMLRDYLRRFPVPRAVVLRSEILSMTN
jgi:hypothetical protein